MGTRNIAMAHGDAGERCRCLIRHTGVAESVLATFDPQIIIRDIEMPGADGISLLQLLRARRNGLPAIAVSRYADAHSRARVAAAGFNGFVAKPLDPVVLIQEIVRALTPPED